MRPSPSQSGLATLRIVQGLVVVLLAYWGLFALFAPVTVWDAHVYNLGRIPVVEQDGFWSSSLWTSERQLVFPWTFDAIHTPFLQLGWGFGLPSFLCLLGTLIVAKSLFARWFGPESSWVVVLGLLSLPTLVYQATIPKNDLAVLFGLAVWLHAMLLWRDRHRPVHLVLGAVALAFAAGAKTSGLLPMAVGGVATFAVIRSRPKDMARFLMTLVLAFVLLGSIETYKESHRTYGHPLGPESLRSAHGHTDGLPGALANAARYAFGNLDHGLIAVQTPQESGTLRERACRWFLNAVGLKDRGYKKSGYGSEGYNDTNLRFLNTGMDSAAGYGILGSLGLLLLAFAAVRWRPSEPWWLLCTFAGLMMFPICYLIAWMPWNNRFLLIPFTALTLAVVAFAYRHANSRRWPVLLVIGLAGFGAVANPLTSFNKTPVDLLHALSGQESQSYKERSSMLPVVQAVRDWSDSNPNGIVHLLAGSDSWILPFFYNPAITTRLVTNSEATTLGQTADATNRPMALLILNRADFHHDMRSLRPIVTFESEPHTTLYVAGTRPQPGATTDVKVIEGLYPDGWTGASFVVEAELAEPGRLSFQLWNPTPLSRMATLRSSVEENSVGLAPDQHARIILRVNESDHIRGTVSPSFVPRNNQDSRDGRELGLRIQIAPLR